MFLEDTDVFKSYILNITNFFEIIVKLDKNLSPVEHFLDESGFVYLLCIIITYLLFSHSGLFSIIFHDDGMQSLLM